MLILSRKVLGRRLNQGQPVEDYRRYQWKYKWSCSEIVPSAITQYMPIKKCNYRLLPVISSRGRDPLLKEPNQYLKSQLTEAATSFLIRSYLKPAPKRYAKPLMYLPHKTSSGKYFNHHLTHSHTPNF